MSAGIDVVDNSVDVLLLISSLDVSGQGTSNVERDLIVAAHVSEPIEDVDIDPDHHHMVKKERKKRRRRKPRQRNKNKAVSTDVSDSNAANILEESNDATALLNEMSDNLTIQAIRSQTNGTAIRKRNNKCRYISIYTFLKSKKPYVFVSKQCRKLIVATKSNDRYYRTDCKATPKNGIITGSSYKRNVKNDRNEHLQSSSASGKNKNRRKKLVYTNSKLEKSPKFEDYLQYDEVEEGLYLGRLIKGVVRINPKNCKHAYVSNPDRSSQDYMINSLVDRNRALEGDVVALKLTPESESKAAVVVYIINKVHPRTAIGTLSELYDKGRKVIALLPRDKRLPRIVIPKTSLPLVYLTNPKENDETLFIAKMTDWTSPKFATGVIISTVGQRNDLQVETKALLLENQLNIEPFPASVYKYLPKSSEIPPIELEKREDLRKNCIFTIDPQTARDLDDAVSCKELPNGNLEVGVHIADVSHFLEENTDLDKIVSEKATTIYLVDNVYHMLPVELCLHCSLLPGKDALAFSVFWEMTKEGEILNHRFSRTVINSCCQLAYEHAQKIIDDDEDWGDLPDVYNGFDANEIRRVVNGLKRISRRLRVKRFESGALKIDQVKLNFKLDETGGPSDIFVYENRESHRLIEEFMLLANITTARQISEYSPDLAFLRCHEPPHPRLVAEVQQMLEVVGIHIDTSTSGSLHSGLQTYSTSDYLGATRNAVLNHLFAKPMTRARYFCAANSSAETFHHYALSVPIYTHFTSPIRRYADILVHRLLAASLGYRERPTWNIDYVEEIADICNKQKYNAKRAGEASSDLFLAHYIETHQPFVQDAVVVNVKERTFDVLVLNTGSIVRMFTNNLGEGVKCSAEQISSAHKMWKICVTYPSTDDVSEAQQVIELFQVIRVNLKRKDKTCNLKGEIVRPGSNLQ